MSLPPSGFSLSSSRWPSWISTAASLSPTELAQWVETLPPEALEAIQELEAAAQPRSNKYLDAYRRKEPRFPSATQRAGMLLDDREHVLFGGATGGGKSSWLLGEAAKYLDVPGYSALIFRRKYTDLTQPDALIPRSREWFREWLAKGATWNGELKQWTFPTSDPARPAVLKFGYMDSKGDEENYQGAAAHFWGFDEAGQFDPSQMEYLQTRARRPLGSEIPIRFRYTANPGGRSHDWLVQKFVMSTDRNWVFVPSFARDNPGLDVADYVRRLDAISDPVLRAQMRDGDWGAVDRSGLVCPEWTSEVEAACCYDYARKPAFYTVYAGADPGSTDMFVVLWGFVDFIGQRLVVLDERWWRNPRTDEVGDATVEVEKQHFAEDLKAERIDAVQRFTDIDHRFVADLRHKPWCVAFTPTQKTDHDMWERMLRTAIRRGQVIIHPRCELLLRTLRHARRKANGDYERTEGTGHADAWAALLYLFRNVNWNRNPYPPVAQEARSPFESPKPVARTFAQRAAAGALPSFKPLG